jgi:hypothetical protein
MQRKVLVTRSEDFFMVNPSPDVTGRDFNNWSEDDAEGSSIGEINNILNATDSTVIYKLGDEDILYNHLNNYYFKHQTSTYIKGFSSEY